MRRSKYPFLSPCLWAAVLAVLLFLPCFVLAEEPAVTEPAAVEVAVLPLPAVAVEPVVAQEPEPAPIEPPPFALAPSHVMSLVGKGSKEMLKLPLRIKPFTLGELSGVVNFDVLTGWEAEKPLWGIGLSATFGQDGKGVNLGIGKAQSVDWCWSIGWALNW